MDLNRYSQEVKDAVQNPPTMVPLFRVTGVPAGELAETVPDAEVVDVGDRVVFWDDVFKFTIVQKVDESSCPPNMLTLYDDHGYTLQFLGYVEIDEVYPCSG